MSSTQKQFVAITGASSGIGRAVVESSLAYGIFPILLVRNVAEIKKRYAHIADQVEVLRIDFADPASILPAVEGIRATIGAAGLQGLVNCAGVNLPGPLEVTPTSRMEEQFRINVFGPIELTRQCISMLRKSKGKVITIGSKLARLGAPFLGPYCASKAAIRRWNDALRLELAPQGISVIMVEPGSVQTPIWEKTKAAGLQFWRGQSEEMQLIYGGRIEGTIRGAASIADAGIPAAKVGDKVIQLLKQDSPRPWVGMGRDTIITMILAKVLPVRWFDRMITGSRTKK